MKHSSVKALLMVFCLLASVTITAQQTDTTAKDNYAKTQYAAYMKKRSTYRTAGWVLLGTGVGLAGTYLLLNFSNGWNGPNKAEGMFEAGVGAVVLSAPFFIMAGANKRKAKLTLKGERLTSAIVPRRPFYPALSVSIVL